MTSRKLYSSVLSVTIPFIAIIFAAYLTQRSHADLRSPVSVHVLDVGMGRPAQGIPIKLNYLTSEGILSHIGSGTTDVTGRVDLMSAVDFIGGSSDPLCCFGSDVLKPGTYALEFKLDSYVTAQTGKSAFMPKAVVYFRVRSDERRNYFHIPMLLSGNSITVYKGS